MSNPKKSLGAWDKITKEELLKRFLIAETIIDVMYEYLKPSDEQCHEIDLRCQKRLNLIPNEEEDE